MQGVMKFRLVIVNVDVVMYMGGVARNAARR
jgi:hypothetical protein